MICEWVRTHLYTLLWFIAYTCHMTTSNIPNTQVASATKRR